MAASAKSKVLLATVSTLKTKASTSPEAATGAQVVHLVVEDAASGEETRAEALVIERELEAPPTAEDQARRDLLMQRLAGFAARA
jgi:hypothetical protein